VINYYAPAADELSFIVDAHNLHESNELCSLTRLTRVRSLTSPWEIILQHETANILQQFD